jgi:hypothetical protein
MRASGQLQHHQFGAFPVFKGYFYYRIAVRRLSELYEERLHSLALNHWTYST